MGLFLGDWEARSEMILKLKLLCDSLRVWNKEFFGMVEDKKKNLLDEINFWDSNKEHGNLLDTQRLLRIWISKIM